MPGLSRLQINEVRQCLTYPLHRILLAVICHRSRSLCQQGLLPRLLLEAAPEICPSHISQERIHHLWIETAPPSFLRDHTRRIRATKSRLQTKPTHERQDERGLVNR